jgi:hypothetical protein
MLALGPRFRGDDEGNLPSIEIQHDERYIFRMNYVLPALVLLAGLGALGALGLGLVSMARGDNPRRSNKIMQARVLLQGLALLLFAIFMMVYHR